MKRINILGAIFVIILLSGCGAPKIDASSDETMKASIEKVRESLPKEKRSEFDQAVQVVAFSQLDMKEIMAAEPGDSHIDAKLRQSLNGKTGEEIIAEADKIQNERKERERQQAVEEIRELEDKRVKSENARDQLKKVEVIRSRFYMEKQEYIGNRPIIEITVKNGTGQAISRAYFEGTIASPGRSVPWYKGKFNYSIPGGLEAGEQAKWTLAPNMYSDWGKVDAPADAVFTVTVEQIDGADGKPIYSTTGFDEHDQERLTELKKQYGIK